MKFISIFLVFCLINASIAVAFSDDDDSSLEPDDTVSEKVGSMGDNGEPHDHDSDNEDSMEAASNEDNAASSTSEPNSGGESPRSEPVSQPNPPNPIANSPERMPEPDYRAVNMRDHFPDSCHGGQYQCQKSTPQQQQIRCIPQEWRCNGLRDCELNDDEKNCSPNQLTRGRTQARCTQDQYQCHGTGVNSIPPQCIDRRQVCDGTYQCSYGDDEANCAERRDQRREPYPYSQPYSQDQRRPDNTADSNAQRPSDTRDIRPYQPNTAPVASDRKSDDYVQRLEWRDRCFRSCLKY